MHHWTDIPRTCLSWKSLSTSKKYDMLRGTISQFFLGKVFPANHHSTCYLGKYMPGRILTKMCEIWPINIVRPATETYFLNNNLEKEFEIWLIVLMWSIILLLPLTDTYLLKGDLKEGFEVWPDSLLWPEAWTNVLNVENDFSGSLVPERPAPWCLAVTILFMVGRDCLKLVFPGWPIWWCLEASHIF